MRKLVLTFTVATLAMFNLNTSLAQTESKTETTNSEVNEDGAVITMDKEVHDYGTITQGDDGSCKFTVTNTGKEPLIISLCKGSCGCTVPVCPQEPIAPGESAEISVKYNTNKVGPINKSVTITSNAVNEPRKVVRIKGNVKAKPSGSAPLNNGGPTNN
ncbi:MAG: DUF1573 domain-containing protein [Crocinitomicaceae bacterium]|nr:DUF1573 domain-containing protein [Crocinitomicaceae bacterium]